MLLVGRDEICCFIPGVVVRNARSDLPVFVGERLGHQVAAFFWVVGRSKVHGLRFGRHLVHGFDSPLGGEKVGIRLPGIARRPRLGALAHPVLQVLPIRILCHQVLECGAAGSNHARDHQRSFDFVFQNFGALLERLLGKESLLQHMHKLVSEVVGYLQIAVEIFRLE